MSALIACTTTDVYGYGCPCKKNDWEHEWSPANPPSTRTPGLHWCGNCDCCVADMTEATESEPTP